MVGIISELLFYVNVMNDIKEGIIGYDEPQKDKEKELYKRINSLAVKGIFLTNELHPLLHKQDAILNLLNNSNKKLSFEFVKYDWNDKKRKVEFP
jgi:hypothetical protein